jgi:hypothetical protein
MILAIAAVALVGLYFLLRPKEKCCGANPYLDIVAGVQPYRPPDRIGVTLRPDIPPPFSENVLPGNISVDPQDNGIEESIWGPFWPMPPLASDRHTVMSGLPRNMPPLSAEI